ncbi:MAG: Gldg family protein, partial [Cyanobacteria bacterium P01_F01_bin.42]
MRRAPLKLRIGQNVFLGVLWMGTVLAIAGLSIRFITEVWSNLAIALLIVGLLSIALILLLRWRFGPPGQHQVSWWRRRSLQTSANALIATTAVVIMLTVGNIVAVRFGTQFDLTEVKEFSLAPQTQEVLRQLPQPLKVWSFTNAPNPEERTLLEKFRQVNPEKFQFEFVNPQLQPGIANRLEVTAPDQVVLDLGDRRKTLARPIRETDITPALVSLVGNIQATVYFLEGHGEVPLAGGEVNLQSAAVALNRADFTLSPLNLIQQPAVPDDADVLVIAGPKRPYSESEIEALSVYLDRGGSLLAMLDPELQTGLNGLLKDWGMALDNRIIVDVSPSGASLQLGPAVPVVVNYGNHPISEDFGQGFSYYPLAQTIKVDEKFTQQVVPFIFSQERTWAEADPDNDELAFDPEQDLQGPLTIGVTMDSTLSVADEAVVEPQSTENAADEDQSTDTSAANDEPSEDPSTDEQPSTRMVVIGDSDFATSGPFEQGLNGDVFLNSVSWLAENQLNLSIRPQEQVERRLDIPRPQFRILALV